MMYRDSNTLPIQILKSDLSCLNTEYKNGYPPRCRVVPEMVRLSRVLQPPPTLAQL